MHNVAMQCSLVNNDHPFTGVRVSLESAEDWVLILT